MRIEREPEDLRHSPLGPLNPEITAFVNAYNYALCILQHYLVVQTIKRVSVGPRPQG